MAKEIEPLWRTDVTTGGSSSSLACLRASATTFRPRPDSTVALLIR